MHSIISSVKNMLVCNRHATLRKVEVKRTPFCSITAELIDVFVIKEMLLGNGIKLPFSGDGTNLTCRLAACKEVQHSYSKCMLLAQPWLVRLHLRGKLHTESLFFPPCIYH